MLTMKRERECRRVFVFVKKQKYILSEGRTCFFRVLCHQKMVGDAAGRMACCMHPHPFSSLHPIAIRLQYACCPRPRNPRGSHPCRYPPRPRGPIPGLQSQPDLVHPLCCRTLQSRSTRPIHGWRPPPCPPSVLSLHPRALLPEISPFN